MWCLKDTNFRDFPAGPVVKTSPSNAEDEGSIAGWGAKIPHASWPGNQNLEWKQCCGEFNKDFKNGLHQKKKKNSWASLVAQRLRICLPMQGTRVRALVWEDPTCCEATRPVSHNY